MKELQDYSNYQGNLKGKPILGTIAYMGGIPFVYELFTYSLMQMVQYNEQKIEGLLHYESIRSSSHSYARNILSKQTYGDWILMLDTDIRFDPDLTVRMLDVFNKYKLPVLTGVYLYKKPPHFPVIYTWNSEKKKYQVVKNWHTKDNQLDIFEINASGAGVLMVRKEVFQYIEQELHEQPFAIRKPFDNPDEIPLGEDFSFFDRCRQLDIQVFCDPRITVEHIAPKPFVVGEDYQPHIIDGIST